MSQKVIDGKIHCAGCKHPFSIHQLRPVADKQTGLVEVFCWPCEFVRIEIKPKYATGSTALASELEQVRNTSKLRANMLEAYEREVAALRDEIRQDRAQIKEISDKNGSLALALHRANVTIEAQDKEIEGQRHDKEQAEKEVERLKDKQARSEYLDELVRHGDVDALTEELEKAFSNRKPPELQPGETVYVRPGETDQQAVERKTKSRIDELEHAQRIAEKIALGWLEDIPTTDIGRLSRALIEMNNEAETQHDIRLQKNEQLINQRRELKRLYDENDEQAAKIKRLDGKLDLYAEAVERANVTIEAQAKNISVLQRRLYERTAMLEERDKEIAALKAKLPMSTSKSTARRFVTFFCPSCFKSVLPNALGYAAMHVKGCEILNRCPRCEQEHMPGQCSLDSPDTRKGVTV